MTNSYGFMSLKYRSAVFFACAQCWRVDLCWRIQSSNLRNPLSGNKIYPVLAVVYFIIRQFKEFSMALLIKDKSQSEADQKVR